MGNNLRLEVINTELSDSSLTVISSIKSRDFNCKVSCVDDNLKSKSVDIERSDGSLTTVSPLSSSSFDLSSKSTQINTQYKSNSFELEGFEAKSQVLSLLSRFEIWL